MRELSIVQIEIDLAANILHLALAGSVEGGGLGPASTVPATIDVGVGGRLIGVDLGEGYVPVMEPEANTETLIRSADIDADVVVDPDSGNIVSIAIPRRGVGYEITYPSGNQ